MTNFMVFDNEKKPKNLPKYRRLAQKERNEAKQRVLGLSKGGCPSPFCHWFSSIIKQPTALCFMRKAEAEDGKCKMDLTYIRVFSCVCVCICMFTVLMEGT
ncbi:hypothetical protein HAX54_008486 [Datura stramonium]|uniref:Uncharacterized protein n=1 Tax=Datura stramonium TaxID=4076 RepID=A0ABS8TD99_DATST|nr:hypothetical protein [Datura stramonium]